MGKQIQKSNVYIRKKSSVVSPPEGRGNDPPCWEVIKMKKKTILTVGLCLILSAALLGACTANTKSAAPEETIPPEEITAPASPEEFAPSEKAAFTASPEPVSAPATALYEYPEGSMSLVIPEGWEYEVQTKEMKAREDGLVLCGIDFWPSEHPAMCLEFGYWSEQIGMCGTGVTIEQIDFGGGLSAWRYTETIDGAVWLTIIYDHVGGGRPYAFAIEGDIDEALWEQYEAEIMDIAASAVMTVKDVIVD